MRGKMFVDEVIALLYARVKGVLNKILFSIRSWFFDVEYVPFTKEEIRKYLKEWVEKELPKLVYTSERFDCDDFAGYFKYWLIRKSGKNGVGRAIGKVYYDSEFLGYHAWNFVVLEDGVVAYIEPQTGDLFYTNTLGKWRYELVAVTM